MAVSLLWHDQALMLSDGLIKLALVGGFGFCCFVRLTDSGGV